MRKHGEFELYFVHGAGMLALIFQPFVGVWGILRGFEVLGGLRIWRLSFS